MTRIFLSEVEWRPVVGYEGIYEVSNTGLVRTVAGKELKPYLHKQGYLRIKLTSGGTRKSFLIHRLVAEAFIPNEHELPTINHKDGDPSNNDVSNLEWCTQKENVAHAVETGAFAGIVSSVTLKSKTTQETFKFRSMSDASRFLSKNRMFVSQLIRNGKTEYGDFSIVVGRK